MDHKNMLLGENLEIENEKIEKTLREAAKKLFADKEVDLIIGYGKGTLPLTSTPIFVRNENDIDKLIWDNTCYLNLAKYLIKPPKIESREKDISPKIGIISKGCVARAIVQLAVEKQINIDNIKIIGINCNGVINKAKIEAVIGDKEIESVNFEGNKIIIKGTNFEEKLQYQDYINDMCKFCKIRAPPISESLSRVIVGESQPSVNLDDDFSDLAEYESKTPAEKWNYVKDIIKSCTRCYACREACPFCYCNLCFVDQNLPTWFDKTSDLSDITIFHMVRAFHLAGRCVGCGACHSVCPVGIDLSFITRILEKIVKVRFDFTSGINLEIKPPMMTYRMDDKEDFMMEEI
ncbi:MAG: 4Fe-4S binding protein [Promethearchaeota archaeon]